MQTQFLTFFCIPFYEAALAGGDLQQFLVV